MFWRTLLPSSSTQNINPEGQCPKYCIMLWAQQWPCKQWSG